MLIGLYVVIVTLIGLIDLYLISAISFISTEFQSDHIIEARMFRSYVKHPPSNIKSELAYLYFKGAGGPFYVRRKVL